MTYVALYKVLMLIQKKANGGKERTFDTFFAGLVGGYIVFGDRSAVNEQVRSPYHLNHIAQNGLTYTLAFTWTKKGRAVRLFARNRIIHTPRYPQTSIPHGDG